MEENIHKRVKELILAKGLTNISFSSLINASATSVYAILNGKANPSFDMLNRIARAMPDVDLNWLVTGQGAMIKQGTQMMKPVVVEQQEIDLLTTEIEKLQRLQEDYRSMIMLLNRFHNADSSNNTSNS